MNDLIDFFELLKFDKIASNIEFSTQQEQLTITKGNSSYLFYFTQIPSIFRSNLCKEIIMITEDNAHLKLDFNNQLSEYLELKFQGKSVKESKKIKCPEDFISKFEEKLSTYYSFNYIYLKLKIKDENPDEKKTIKKSKI